MALKLVKPKVKNTHWGLALLVAIVLDVLDWAVIGSIPIYGDVFDLIGMGILFRLLGPLGLIGAIELVPVVDVLPMFTISVILAWLYADSKRMLR